MNEMWAENPLVAEIREKGWGMVVHHFACINQNCGCHTGFEPPKLLYRTVEK